MLSTLSQIQWYGIDICDMSARSFYFLPLGVDDSLLTDMGEKT